MSYAKGTNGPEWEPSSLPLSQASAEGWTPPKLSQMRCPRHSLGTAKVLAYQPVPL